MEIELRLGLVNFGAEVTTTTVLSRLLFKSDVVGLKKQSLAIFSHKPVQWRSGISIGSMVEAAIGFSFTTEVD